MSPPGACVVSGSVPTVDLIGRLVNDRTGVVLQLSGEIDLSTLPLLRDHLTRLVHEHPRATVRADLDGVISLDDTGLGILLGVAALARSLGGEPEVFSSPGRIRERLAATRTDLAVTVHPAATA